jgi:hypothetical protein
MPKHVHIPRQPPNTGFPNLCVDRQKTREEQNEKEGNKTIETRTHGLESPMNFQDFNPFPSILPSTPLFTLSASQSQREKGRKQN